MPTCFWIMIAVLVLALFSSFPRWPHSRGWGYRPSGYLALVLLFLALVWWMSLLQYWGAYPYWWGQ